MWIAGYDHMLMAALMRSLSKENCKVLATDRVIDLRHFTEVDEWLMRHKPDAIFLIAAPLGGILADEMRPADFFYDNLAIESNVIEGAKRNKVQKLLLLGSSCIYPKFSPQPIKEDMLLTGPLEPTKQWYAIAKIAGLKFAQAYRLQYGLDFISAVSTDIYGPNDNFDLLTGHVIPALIRKCHEAKVRGDRTTTIWGTGTPRREFLYIDDCADALVHLMKNYSSNDPVNVGVGNDISILDLARTVAKIVGFSGEFAHDLSKPDGTPRRLLDVSRLTSLGWRAKVPLMNGIAETYQWYLSMNARTE